jgi:hypothetical protein
LLHKSVLEGTDDLGVAPPDVERAGRRDAVDVLLSGDVPDGRPLALPLDDVEAGVLEYPRLLRIDVGRKIRERLLLYLLPLLLTKLCRHGSLRSTCLR